MQITHTHVLLWDVDAGTFCGDIDQASEALDGWIKAVHYPLCHLGETTKKRTAVNAHLEKRGLGAVEVTPWADE